jgi:mannose-1-phosphate guanylyltransferase
MILTIAQGPALESVNSDCGVRIADLNLVPTFSMATSSPDPSALRPPHATFALILAGGSGQRFWPASRDRLPKQLLKLFDGRTMLEHTVARLEGLVPKENILILTNHLQLEGARAALPDFPAENIVAEPEKRDTAAAIALAVGWVAARDPRATMMVLPSDHLIQDRAAFQKTVQVACAAAQKSGALVTIGIKPTWACPGYGYIERGARFAMKSDDLGIPVFDVVRFREKPAPELAEQFLAQGNFAWNAGMFFWTVPTMREELARHCPELSTFVDTLAASQDFAATVKATFPSLPKLSIDYALMERASRVLNVEAVFDWDDVGNWTSVGAHLNCDSQGNQHNCAVSQLDADNNIVFTQTKQHVALLGVSDLLVISTGDALLVAHRSQAEKIKKLVDGLPEELR